VLFDHKYCTLQRKVEVLKLALLRFVSVVNLLGYLNITFMIFFVVRVAYCWILL